MFPAVDHRNLKPDSIFSGLTVQSTSGLTLSEILSECLKLDDLVIAIDCTDALLLLWI